MSSRPTYMWSGTEWLSIAPGIGDEGGITDHQGLTGRTDPDSHPIESITDLQPALDNKSDITHTHQGLDLDAGVGISIDGVDPTVISNTDLGSEAVNEHINVIDNPDPHIGVYAGIAHLHAEYSPTSHLHDDLYSEIAHVHDGLYDPTGTADAAVLEHTEEPDPHAVYLLPPDVLSGDGIQVTDIGDGTVRIDNTAQNGQPLTVASLACGGTQSIPHDTWTLITDLSVDGDTAGLVDPVTPYGFTAQTRGVYIIIGTVGMPASPTGERAIRVLINGTVADGGINVVNAPSQQPSVQTISGQWLLEVGDVVTFETYHTAGSGLVLDGPTTRMTISMINGATSDRIVGVGATQTVETSISDSTFRGLVTETIVFQTIDCTVGTILGDAGIVMGPDSPSGWYDLVVSAGFAGNNTGNRRMQVLLNSSIANAPLIPKMNVLSAGGGIVTTLQVAGPILLVPGDYLRPEIFQNTGNALLTSPANCSISLLFRGIAATEGIV